jgi:hypothetical protein
MTRVIDLDMLRICIIVRPLPFQAAMVVMNFIANFQIFIGKHKLLLVGVLAAGSILALVTLLASFSQRASPDSANKVQASIPASEPAPEDTRVHHHRRADAAAAAADGGLGAVDQALADLVDANIAFNVPDHAAINKTLIIEAKLSTRLDQDQLKKLIDEAGPSEGATIKIADRMAATLSGGSAFDISPPGPQEQWISKSDTTAWTWEITPKSAGAQILILSFDAILTINGKDDRRTINTFKKTISVDVSKAESLEDWLEAIKKYGEDISWIWATILIPVGGAVWAWFRRKRQPDAPSSASGSK